MSFVFLMQPASSDSQQRVAGHTVKVAAIGDSITDGYGVASSGRDKNSYPAQLQYLLGYKYQVVNYGLSGKTLIDPSDSPYRDTDFFKTSHKASPNIVLIMLGTNDTKPQNWNSKEYENQLKDFVYSYRSLDSRPKIYLMTPPAAYNNDFGINNDTIKNEVVPIVRRVAEQTHTPCIDIFLVTKQHPEYFSDGVHPNQMGYKIIADKVYVSLTQASFSDLFMH